MMELQLDQFKVGDVLRLVGEVDELLIEKVWLSTQGPYRWVDYETRTRRSRRRLIVSAEYDDGEWEVVVYDQLPSAAEVPYADQLPATLLWSGLSFQREERGRCTLRLVSDPASFDIPCTYADYRGPDDLVLAVEVFGDAQTADQPVEVEVFAGRVLEPTDVQLHLPIDTAVRSSLVTRVSTATADNQPATVSFTQRQLVIGGVVIAILVLFLVMAL